MPWPVLLGNESLISRRDRVDGVVHGQMRERGDPESMAWWEAARRSVFQNLYVPIGDNGVATA